MQKNASGGELLVREGVDEQLVGAAPRRGLALRGREEPIEAFVLTVEHQAPSPTRFERTTR
jgi:hypothetical protein